MVDSFLVVSRKNAKSCLKMLRRAAIPDQRDQAVTNSTTRKKTYSRLRAIVRK